MGEPKRASLVAINSSGAWRGKAPLYQRLAPNSHPLALQLERLFFEYLDKKLELRARLPYDRADWGREVEIMWVRQVAQLANEFNRKSTEMTDAWDLTEAAAKR